MGWNMKLLLAFAFCAKNNFPLNLCMCVVARNALLMLTYIYTVQQRLSSTRLYIWNTMNLADPLQSC